MSDPESDPAVPYGHTARRLEWRFLPPQLRALVENRCGSPVVDAVSQTGGFTPGFASVLTCADASRHFVKAASVQAQPAFAESYRQEARKLALLPASVPAPGLLWSHDDEWVVLGIEYVEGRLAQRPWQADELDRCLDALETAADALTPVPEELSTLGLATFESDFASFAACWDGVRETSPGPARRDLAHLDEAAGLTARYGEVCGGDSVVHTDIRDDNLILGAAGEVWICDWNWPVVGADWLDTLFLLIHPRGDGLDVEAILAQRQLTRAVPAEHIDIVLALLAGYFLGQGDQPVPSTSPHLRAHQQWCARVTWHWLAERRHWT